MDQSRGIRRFKKIEVVFIVLWVILMGICVLTDKNEFSKEADVTELYLCNGMGENGSLLPMIGVISPSARSQGIFVCGHAVTDGRPADIDILIYSVRHNELIYNLPVGVAVPNGNFAFLLPEDILKTPGDYRIEATFDHHNLLTSTIEVIR